MGRSSLFERLKTKGDNRSDDNIVKICAPMVRYSKLPFRMLVRRFGCDLAFTPMILADAFAASDACRQNEFTTNEEDRPLVVQFAAHKADDFVAASQLVAPYADGVDLNCGCPQRWAVKEGIGACLIDKPDFIRDLVRQTKSVCGNDDFSVSVKIRIHDDLSRTIDLCRQIESAGADFLTVHGRTIKQRSEPVNIDAIREIKCSLGIPVIANGDIRSLEDTHRVRDLTGVDGVMAARGILENPAMYAGFSVTPTECVEEWVRIALEVGTPFTTFHHHLIYMCDKLISRAERRIFNSLSSTSAVLDFLRESCDIKI